MDATNLWAPSSMATVETDLPPAGDLSPAGGISWTEADIPFPANQPQQAYSDSQERDYYQLHANPIDSWEPETVPVIAPVGELSPAGADTGDPKQAHEASVSRNALEAEINSLNQISGPHGPGWIGEMLDACDADDAWGSGQGSVPAHSSPAGVPVHEGTALPHIPVTWDAPDDPRLAFLTVPYGSLVAQDDDGSDVESFSL